MAGNLTENYNELCRLCASKINLLLGINIFAGEGSAREIDKQISTCLPIQVHEADRLPKMICGECVYKLDLFCTFREKSIQTENLLIELVKKLNDTTNTEKMDDSKIISESRPVNIMTIAQDFDQTDISIPHDLTEGETIMVNQQIILTSHDNITINHELDNIEITPHELNMSHENTQLHLHHESSMSQLVAQEMQIPESQLQNLELLPQNNLITDHYETIETDGQNCIENTILNVKEPKLCTKKIEPDVKNVSQPEIVLVKTSYSDASDSEESAVSEPEFESTVDTSGGENSKTDPLIINQIYEEQEHVLLTNAEITNAEQSENVTYYCNVCGKTMNNKEDYIQHYEEHINKCFTCDRVFDNLDELNEHRKQVHPQKSSTNNFKTSNSQQSRARHKNVTTAAEQIDDNFFNEDSSDEDENSLMMRENSSECVQDEDEEGDEDSSSKNGKRKRWEPKICTECGKSYKTNYKLAEHMRKHTGEQPFKCSMCDKAFRSKIGLAQHEAKHTGQYDFACPTCGKGFQCKSYLIVHQRVHSDIKPYPCTTCGRDFKTKQSLLDHNNRHLGVKPYMCDICGRGFITKGLCKSHQKVHSGTDNRQYPCTVCNKLFVSKSYLATHLRIHTGEKPFMCEVCGKGFLTRVDLRIHSTMHTGEKSFVCEMCGKAFARRDALRCHRRSHTGERPYRCDICGQTFTQFSPMAIHKRLHTGERPYSCEVCNKTFVSRSTMMSHRKKHVP